eukprot:Amastigsp_a841337_6.p3 type:complete len:136 gc:universal Amastigsp_a841337_6:235-642(+)
MSLSARSMASRDTALPSESPTRVRSAASMAPDASLSRRLNASRISSDVALRNARSGSTSGPPNVARKTSTRSCSFLTRAASHPSSSAMIAITRGATAAAALRFKNARRSRRPSTSDAERAYSWRHAMRTSASTYG